MGDAKGAKHMHLVVATHTSCWSPTSLASTTIFVAVAASMTVVFAKVCRMKELLKRCHLQSIRQFGMCVSLEPK